MRLKPASTYVPWRDRAFVSVNEAAEICARSPDWVRNKISEGRLRATRFDKGGPLVVFVWSIAAFIDGVEPVRPKSIRTAPIYLAVNNT